MAKVILIYGTRHGQTAKIAAVIASLLRRAEHQVDVWRGDQLPLEMALAPYDAIILGGSVIATRHQRCLYRLVRHHHAVFNQELSAFFSVSGAAAGRRPRDQEEARQRARQFLDQTGWHPDLVEIVAGAVPFSRYDRLTRWLMQFYLWRQGSATDPTRDYEYTNWNAVRDFAEAIASMLEQRASRHIPAEREFALVDARHRADHTTD